MRTLLRFGFTGSEERFPASLGSRMRTPGKLQRIFVSFPELRLPLLLELVVVGKLTEVPHPEHGRSGVTK